MNIRLSLAGTLCVCLAACGNHHSFVPPDAGMTLPDGSDGPLDFGTSGDGAAPGNAYYGDRNLQLHEPYPDAVLIQNGGRFYDVRRPPNPALHAAAGDGKTDDTAAFRDAFEYLRNAYVTAANATGQDPNGIYAQTNFWIYVPAGTYRVTDTLTYRTPIALTNGNSYPDLVRVRIAGESRETTVIRLDDAAAGFGDPTHPKIVLEVQHDGTTFNNWPATNLLTNTTIDIGHGNPGAAALWFQGANVSTLYNVTMRSGDGAGFCGLLVQTGSTHGYYRDLTVTGFDYGFCQIPTPNQSALATPNVDSHTALEHVTLQGQRKAGVLLRASGTSLRRFWIDESTTSATALAMEQSGETVVLDDSLLAGNAAKPAITGDATQGGQVLLARDLSTTGYSAAIELGGVTVAQGPKVDEYVSSPPVTLFSGQTAATLRLPVKDTPLVAWFDPATDWANVKDFGATGGADDSAAIQAAMNSGKPVVYFPASQYTLRSTVKIPASVKRVEFLYAQTNGDFEVSEASSEPLLLTHHASGSVVRSGSRPLALTDFDGNVANSASPPADLFLENVVNIGSSSTFTPVGQSTWARFIDDEQPSLGQIDVWANGGKLWVFGFKMENKPVSVFAATNGASLEVLNGEVAQTDDQQGVPMLRNDDSSMSFIGFTELGYSPPFFHFSQLIEETQKGTSHSLGFDGTFAAPIVARGWVPPGTNPVSLVIPLYSGRKQ